MLLKLHVKDSPAKTYLLSTCVSQSLNYTTTLNRMLASDSFKMPGGLPNENVGRVRCLA